MSFVWQHMGNFLRYIHACGPLFTCTLADIPSLQPALHVPKQLQSTTSPDLSDDPKQQNQ